MLLKLPHLTNRLFSIAALVLAVAGNAFSANYKVLYNFNASNANPSSGLIIDASGNAYGTTFNGNDGYGTVYELSPKTGYHLLYKFTHNDLGGVHPQGDLVLDSAGNVYGTTVDGGANKSACAGAGCGVVFELSPPSNGGLWTETVLYSFCSQPNCADGANPEASVIFDSAGNLYGTTENGGDLGIGAVFELSSGLGGSWTEKVIYGLDEGGRNPTSGLLFDSLGNLYGTMQGGDENGGMVFELSPSGQTWQFSALYAFDGLNGTDGYDPAAGVIFDLSGNLYGTTAAGGAAGFGTVYELTPNAGVWTESILYNFAGGNDGATPESSLAIDSEGNLFGTTSAGGGRRNLGTVFRLTNGTSGEWTENVFQFSSNGLGALPTTPVTLGTSGQVYGTTFLGGSGDMGVMFRILQ